MNQHQRLRYSRHILLPEIGEQGQLLLCESRVAIIGVGGIGSAAAQYLAGAGVGLILVDGDVVALSNLPRQVIHSTAFLKQSKVHSAAAYIRQHNPECALELIDQFLDEAGMDALCQRVDLVLDCSDNFPTRFALNRAAHRAQVPLISASAIGTQAQLAVFAPQGGCYRCLYADERAQAPTCANQGVINALVGVIGSMQALWAINILCQIGTAAVDNLTGKLWRLDATTGTWKTSAFHPDPHCPVCAAK